MKVLYLPVETARRELDSKFAVAIKAIQLGVFDEVMIGLDSELFQRAKKPGVVLLKSAASFESHKISSLKKQGHLVFALDEEGIVPPLNDPSINSRFSPENMGLLDGIFCNGPAELNSFPDWVKKSDKLIMSGNPRFDFYHEKHRDYYKDSVSRIRKELGDNDIILIASRFGDVNIVEGQNCEKILEKTGFLNSQESRAFFKGFMDHSTKIFQSMLEIPEQIARAFPDKNIIIRPHPSESYKKWKDVCTLSNMHVRSDFDIATWLACSHVMIHNGCTTAVESTAMKVPVITFSPVKSQEFDLHYPNELGQMASNGEEVIALLDEIFKDRIEPSYSRLTNIMYLPSEVYASQRIAKILSEKVQLNDLGEKTTRCCLNDLFFYFKYILKTILHDWNLRKDYQRIKYPHLSLKNYKEKIHLISTIFGFSSNFSVNKIGVDLISIKRSE